MITILTLLVLAVFALGFSYIVLNAMFEAVRVAGSESRHHAAVMLVVWGFVETGLATAIIVVALGGGV